jgi:hypothetical protein
MKGRLYMVNNETSYKRAIKELVENNKTISSGETSLTPLHNGSIRVITNKIKIYKSLEEVLENNIISRNEKLGKWIIF